MKKPLLGTSKLAPYLFVIGLISVVALIPALAHADVDGSLRNIQGALVNRILPVMGMIGLALAGLSYFSGNPSAHGHLKLALIGAVVGFLGPAIIEFIRGLVQ